MCTDGFMPSAGCYDYAGFDELAMLAAFERPRTRTSPVYHNECSPLAAEEGHVFGPGSKNCWCNPNVYPSRRGTEIVHNLIVPLNAS